MCTDEFEGSRAMRGKSEKKWSPETRRILAELRQAAAKNAGMPFAPTEAAQQS